MDSTETSFEFPMQHVNNFEPLYPGASITRFGAYYCIVLFAHKFKLYSWFDEVTARVLSFSSLPSKE